jgi:hypothetical protein
MGISFVRANGRDAGRARLIPAKSRARHARPIGVRTRAVDAFNKRLPHVLTRADWAHLLAKTYAAAQSIDEDIALERLERAVHGEALLKLFYSGLGAALLKAKGARTTEDAFIDKLSVGVENRRSKIHALKSSPAVAAALVRIDLEIGHAPEMMREALANPKGAALMTQGFEEIGAFILKELVK